MTYSYKRHIFFLAAIATLVAGMYLCSGQNDKESYVALLKDIRLLRQLDAEFNENILLARNLILKSYDPIVKTDHAQRVLALGTRNEVKHVVGISLFSIMRPLDSYAAYEEAGRNLHEGFDKYILQQQARSQKMETFKSYNAVLKNSLDYLPDLHREITLQAKKNSALSETRIAQLNHLYQSVLLFSSNNNLQAAQPIAAEIAGARQWGAALPPGWQDKVLRFLDHCEVVVTKNTAIIGQLRFLVQKDDKGILEKVYSAASFRYDVIQGQQNIFKIALFVTVFILIIYALFLFRLLYQSMLTLSESNEMLKKADKAKSEFLANMSHEIRTPLNGIIGLTQLLSESRMLPEQKESIQAVLKSGESLLFLLNDILDFSKIEAGELVFESVPFDLKDSLRRVIDLMSPLASKKGLVIEFSYDAQTPSVVAGDTVRIGQIITNLLGNALKFTDKGHVRISVTADAHPDAGYRMFSISVSDTGIGIPPDKYATLFRQFSQVDASTTRKYGGTGLGLAISKKLAEAMKGDITFSSEQGKGTVFTARLPLPLSDAPLHVLEQKAGVVFRASASFAGRAVLVVDDHPVNRLFATKLLARMGFECIHEAVTGVDALRKLAESAREYDLILMDCQMPEMDGFEACRRIREEEVSQGKPRKPVIAMTAHAMEGDKERCLQVGMDDYLSKPINPDKLLTILETWIAHVKTSGGHDAPLHDNDDSPRESGTAAPPVDLGMLELFTEGDQEQEIILADAYLSAGSQTLESLKQHVSGHDASDQEWKQAAHKLKGSSAQIGASRMSNLCLLAEKGFQGPVADKSAMLSQIESEFYKIDAFFLERRKSA